MNFALAMENLYLELDKLKSGFKLTYCDLGNTTHSLFFTKQFFTLSLKIMIPKHNMKKKKVFSLTEKQYLFFLLPSEMILVPLCLVYVSAYTLKLRGIIDHSYLKKLHK